MKYDIWNAATDMAYIFFCSETGYKQTTSNY